MPRPKAGEDILVSATVRPRSATVRAAALYYVVNFGQELRLPLSNTGGTGAALFVIV